MKGGMVPMVRRMKSMSKPAIRQGAEGEELGGCGYFCECTAYAEERTGRTRDRIERDAPSAIR